MAIHRWCVVGMCGMLMVSASSVAPSGREEYSEKSDAPLNEPWAAVRLINSFGLEEEETSYSRIAELVDTHSMQEQKALRDIWDGLLRGQAEAEGVLYNTKSGQKITPQIYLKLGTIQLRLMATLLNAPRNGVWQHLKESRIYEDIKQQSVQPEEARKAIELLLLFFSENKRNDKFVEALGKCYVDCVLEPAINMPPEEQINIQEEPPADVQEKFNAFRNNLSLPGALAACIDTLMMKKMVGRQIRQNKGEAYKKQDPWELYEEEEQSLKKVRELKLRLQKYARSNLNCI